MTFDAREKVSLCVVVHNESAQIAAFLETLLKTQTDSAMAEVIVVDNASTDATAQIAQDMLSKHISQALSYKIIQLRENNMGMARAVAVRAAHFPWVAFLDADCRPQAGWLNTLLRTAQTCTGLHQLGGVGGMTSIDPKGGSFANALSNLAKFSFFAPGSNQFKTADHLKAVQHKPTCNILYRRDTILKIGNFNPKLSEACEDLEMSARLNQRGFQIWSDPNAFVEHQQWRGLGNWIQKMQTYGRWQWMVIMRYPQMFGLRHFIAIVIPVVLITLACFPNGNSMILCAIAFLMSALLAIFVGRKQALQTWVLLFVTPLSYSVGFYLGFMKWFVLNESLRPNVSDLQSNGHGLTG